MEKEHDIYHIPVDYVLFTDGPLNASAKVHSK